jgi:hypothetical protein
VLFVALLHEMSNNLLELVKDVMVDMLHLVIISYLVQKIWTMYCTLSISFVDTP